MGEFGAANDFIWIALHEKKEYTGSMAEQIDKVMEYLKLIIRERNIITGDPTLDFAQAQSVWQGTPLHPVAALPH